MQGKLEQKQRMMLGIAAVVVAAAAFWASLPAQATVFPARGGQGDRAEEYRCPAGAVLTGFHGRTGAWIDQIGLICSELLPDFRMGSVTRLHVKGGIGGSPAEQYCQQDAGIREIRVLALWTYVYGNSRYQYINAIQFTCARPRDGSAAGGGKFAGAEPGYALNSDLKSTWLSAEQCPGNEYATGLNIRYGGHVNAVGLICDRVQSMAPVGGAGNVGNAGNAGKKVVGLGKKPVGEALNEGMESDTDRPGSDIHRLELQDANPSVCQAKCAGLDRCKAWTYVRPGVQGPKAVCYLKNSVPQVASNKCCVSGVKPSQTYPDALAEPDGFANATARRCKPGFVWREARPSDVVCVTPESRSMVGQENAVAASRWDPSGAYGPNTCVAGFVWREAFDGDVTCVTPERRAAVKEENRVGPSRTE